MSKQSVWYYWKQCLQLIDLSNDDVDAKAFHECFIVGNAAKWNYEDGTKNRWQHFLCTYLSRFDVG